MKIPITLYLFSATLSIRARRSPVPKGVVLVVKHDLDKP